MVRMMGRSYLWLWPIIRVIEANIKRWAARDIEAELAPKINPKIRGLNLTRLAST
jgi:hypothetical protein